MHRGRHCTIRDPDSRERWAAGGGMCHRQEGHEAAIGQIFPSTVSFVVINPSRCRIRPRAKLVTFSDSAVEER